MLNNSNNEKKNRKQLYSDASGNMPQNFFNDYLNGREVPEKLKLEVITQQMLTCSKSTIETLEKSVFS